MNSDRYGMVQACIYDNSQIHDPYQCIEVHRAGDAFSHRLHDTRMFIVNEHEQIEIMRGQPSC